MDMTFIQTFFQNIELVFSNPVIQYFLLASVSAYIFMILGLIRSIFKSQD